MISYLGYLNKLLDLYNKSYCHYIGRKPMDADYSALTKELKTNPKTTKFKIDDRVMITKFRNNFRKSCTKNQYREIFFY